MEDPLVPVERARPQLRITPTTAALTPSQVTTQFERLHALLSPEQTGLLDTLRQPDPPTVEIRLETPPNSSHITYAVSTDPPDHLDALRRHLTTALPTSYELERRERTHHTGDPATAITYRAETDRRRDWQLPLTTLEAVQTDRHTQTPLTTVCETLADAQGAVTVQVLLEPHPDWTDEHELLQSTLEEDRGTLLDQAVNELLTDTSQPATETEISPGNRERLEALPERLPHTSFRVTARAVVNDARDTALVPDLEAAFAAASGHHHRITGTEADDPQRVAEAMAARETATPSYERLRNRLPVTTPTSEGIVADASEVGALTLVDGAALTTDAQQALERTPTERERLPLPPDAQLDLYRTAGFALGRPLTENATPTEEPIAVPPALQPLHQAIIGKTGSGKSTLLTTGMLANQRATDGLDLLIDPKGDGMAREYMLAHRAEHGDLDDVVYFDCSQVLPAIPVLSIEAALEAGIPRATAVQDTVDHYMAMLRTIMGPDRFDQAVRSPDVIRYLLTALFDPVNGSDSVAHRDLQQCVREMRESESVPPVADDDLADLLSGVVANRTRTFDEIMQGVANRIEKIPSDPRLAALFDHTPADGPTFDLGAHLDEDTVVILDTGGLRAEAQRVLTLVVLSNLWTALRRRAHTADANGDQPLVNVYLEEAASVASSELLQELLAQARSFGCSVTLAMQFPAQLQAVDDALYRELINNVSTFVVGNVPVDRQLATRLATGDHDPSEVQAQLGGLKRGEWLATLPAPFDRPEPRPFHLQSLPLPAGHPDRTDPSPAAEAAIEAVRDRSAERGLSLAEHAHTVPTEAAAEDTDADGEDDRPRRVDTALPHTRRLPESVDYDPEPHALVCTRCTSKYAPTFQGLREVMSCCDSIEAIDRDNIPICDLNLKRSPDDVAASEYSVAQLCFLQAVHNAQQQRYHDLEYDLTRDSMIRLQEYVGIDNGERDQLTADGVLAHDTDTPHRLYSVTAAGRDVIGESHRRGVDFGHGKGDLEESSEHVMAVEATRRYLEQTRVADPDDPVTEVVPYYEPGDDSLPASPFMAGDEAAIEDAVDRFTNRRLDLVALDADGQIRVAVEVERINNDLGRAAPADFDKLAATDPDEALWVVPSHTAAHELLGALNDPLEGEPRVDQTYAESTPATSFRIDEPGFTDIMTVTQVLDALDRD